MSSMSCSVDGCEREDIQAKGLCQMHYHRKRRTGAVGVPSRINRESYADQCAIEGCEKADNEAGLCSMHAARVRRHGNPDTVVAPQDRRNRAGDDHHNFRGDDAGYQTMHSRINRRRGPASAHQCKSCEKPALHWAYGHNDPNAKTDERGYLYSTDESEYIPLCVRCHSDLDAHMSNRKQ